MCKNRKKREIKACSMQSRYPERPLHGADRTAAHEICRLCSLASSRRRPAFEVYKRKDNSSQSADRRAPELCPGRLYLCAGKRGAAQILGRGIWLSRRTGKAQQKDPDGIRTRHFCGGTCLPLLPFHISYTENHLS